MASKPWPSIRISATGIGNKQPYLAHTRGNWGPENAGSDYKRHPLERIGDEWVLTNPESVLLVGEQFKILIEGVTREEAVTIHEARIADSSHVGGPRIDCDEDYDFDAAQGTMWFLANDDPDSSQGGYPSVRIGKWNRNSLFAQALPA